MKPEEVTEIFEYIQELLNGIIIDTNDQIKKNNDKIWNLLNNMDNDVWNNIIAELERRDKTTNQFNYKQTEQIHEARKYFDSYKVKDSNCMNIESTKFRPMGKTYAWQLIMMIRETLNKEQGINIPNAKGPGKVKLVTDPRNDLFDWQ